MSDCEEFSRVRACRSVRTEEFESAILFSHYRTIARYSVEPSDSI